MKNLKFNKIKDWLLLILLISIFTLSYATNQELKSYVTDNDIIHIKGVRDDMNLGIEGLPTEYRVNKALKDCNKYDQEKYGVVEQCKILEENFGK